MKRQSGLIFFLFSFIVIKAMEITHVVGDKRERSLLTKKIYRSGNSESALQESISYMLCNRMPREIGKRVCVKLFALNEYETDEFDPSQIKKIIKHTNLSAASMFTTL